MKKSTSKTSISSGKHPFGQSKTLPGKPSMKTAGKGKTFQKEAAFERARKAHFKI